MTAPAHLPVPLAVRDAVLGLAGTHSPGPAVLFSGPPALRMSRPAALRGLLFTIESGIADAIEERLAPAGTRFQAEVLARASIAALRTCLIAYHAAGGPAGAPPGRLRDLVTEAFDLLSPSGTPVR